MNVNAEDDGPSDDSDLLRQFLTRREVPCPRCQYILRDLQSDVCPECGDKIRLQVRSVEPRQAAPLAGLIGLSSGAGLNGLLLVYILIQALFRPFFRDEIRFIVINGIGLLAMGIFLLLWLRQWRWLRARTPAVRWTLAAACWLATLADITIFSLTIR